jgi:SAM-dependent methyltransferase
MMKTFSKRLTVARNYSDLIPAAVSERLGLDRRSKYLFEYSEQILREIEADSAVTTRSTALAALRKLGLSDFGYVLWSMPDVRFPKLSRLLPAMASQDVQRAWTGKSGIPLLKQSVSFVQSVACNFVSIAGQPLRDASVLDFGCGYGRIARLMYYFTDEERFFGVDPWPASLSVCAQAGLTCNFLRSEYLPQELPVGDRRFDLIYAFSVFTHLSERATLSSLSTLRKYIHDEGILVITVRPIEYWEFASHVPASESSDLWREHQQRGFAFRPHPREAVDGDITYGDTSMSEQWLAARCPYWKLVSLDRSLDDRMQRYLYLIPN